MWCDGGRGRGFTMIMLWLVKARPRPTPRGGIRPSGFCSVFSRLLGDGKKEGEFLPRRHGGGEWIPLERRFKRRMGHHKRRNGNSDGTLARLSLVQWLLIEGIGAPCAFAGAGAMGLAWSLDGL